MSKKIFIVICVAVLVVLGTFLLIQQTSQNTPSSTVSPTPFSSGTNPVSFQEIPFPSISPVAVIEDPGVVWLPKPIRLPDDPSLFALFTDSSRLYKAGTQNGQDLLFIFMQGLGEYYRLLRKEGDRYAIIANGQNLYAEPLSNGVYIDYDTKIRSIAWPEQLFVHGLVFTKTSGWSAHLFDEDDPQRKDWDLNLFAYTPYGPMYYRKYISTTTSDPYDQYRFVIRGANGIGVSYSLAYDFRSDDRVPLITWNDGTQNVNPYSDGLPSGCSAFQIPSIVPFNAVNGKVFQSGRTVAGDPVYEFLDIQHPIVMKGYEQTGGQYHVYSPNGVASTPQSLSSEQYYREHGVFVYRDHLGRFLAFFNGKFAPQAECGKPVIYLYPEKPTQVSVKVGAQIRISEPAYGTGWNVLAQPDGTLTTNNTQYDSLFWEGLGHGPYPDITQGFIVKREELETTLWQHLAQLGLNERESADFMEFWLPKMPTTPYTRLTWFGTKEMDILAPLTVVPKPDTSIRIFLDFGGLETPIDIPEQKLSHIPRTGSVLIEWGGLLRHGHDNNP